MNYEMMNNNKVFLQGEVDSEVKLDHAVMYENFYTFNLKIYRTSGQADIIPVMISERLMNKLDLSVGSKLAVKGQFRSYNKLINGKSKLILSVFVREICQYDECVDTPNKIELDGYICKAPIYRTTPFNREICDVLMAVNRNYDKSDYIPCIAWGRNASYVSSLSVGTRLRIDGRIQSREYNKHIEGCESPITLVAYEVSVSKLIPNEEVSQEIR